MPKQSIQLRLEALEKKVNSSEECGVAEFDQRDKRELLLGEGGERVGDDHVAIPAVVDGRRRIWLESHWTDRPPAHRRQRRSRPQQLRHSIGHCFVRPLYSSALLFSPSIKQADF